MGNIGIWSLLCAGLAVSAVQGAESSGTASIGGVDYAVVLMDDVAAPNYLPLPAGLDVNRVQLRPGGSEMTTFGTPSGTKVYENLGTAVYVPVATPCDTNVNCASGGTCNTTSGSCTSLNNRTCTSDANCASGVDCRQLTPPNPNDPVLGWCDTLLADDIQTISAGGCPMTFLSVLVFGGDNRPSPPPPGFRVTQFALFDGCPGQGGNVIVDFLNGVPLTLPNSGVHRIDVDLSTAAVNIPSDVWLGMAFDKSTAGWIGGRAPTIGQSQNIFHVPNFPCSAQFTSATLYSSLTAEIYCSAVQPFFIGYQSAVDSGQYYGGSACPSGVGACTTPLDLELPCESTADDIMPIVSNCQLHGYSINVFGDNSGPTTMKFQLYTSVETAGTTGPIPGVPIPGTQGCTTILGDQSLETVTFYFNGNTVLPPKFWIVMQDSTLLAGPVIAGGLAGVGRSEDEFAVYDQGDNTWLDDLFFGGCEDGGTSACGSFQVTVFCLGEEPTGACCESASGLCTDNTFVRDCNGRWRVNETCAAAGFDPPCGTTACCRVNPSNALQTVCANEVSAACSATGGEPLPGIFCSQADCGNPVCIAAQGDCGVVHGNPGCANFDCCNAVCDAEPFCCNTDFGSWDSGCLEFVTTSCLVPSNDNCSDSNVLSLGTTPFDNLNATTDGPALPANPCDEGGGLLLNSDIWFTHTAALSGTLTVDVCDIQGTYDSRIAVYSGCTCPPSLILDCNDDGCGEGEFGSLVTVPVTAGTCYLIRVGGFGDSTGSGNIALTAEGVSCPSGAAAVTFNPPSGVVDARQPHPTSSVTPRQGIRTIVVNAPPAAASACFSLCETRVDGFVNSVESVVEAPAGVYTVTLARTISTGGVTSLTYTGTNTTGRFTSHPSNVNGDAASSALDILSIIDCLNNVNLAAACPWGFPYSRDIDNSGGFGASDLLRVIDLLNGADQFDSWLSVSRPSGVGCP